MKYNRGLNRDTDPVDQPAGTWRYARNTVIPNNSTDIQGEFGNEFIVSITGGHRTVGSIVLQDEKVVLFTAAGSTPIISEIGIFDPVLETYTVLINDSTNTSVNKFQFSRQFPIQGEYKIDATGQVSIYWTDDKNPMRFLRLYDLPTMGSLFEIETLDIFPRLKEAPYPELSNMISGNLTVGAYALTVALVTPDGTSTNFMNISKWVYVTDKARGLSFADHMCHDHVPGGADHTIPMSEHTATNWSGAEPGLGSGKGIRFRVVNLDDRYTEIRPAIIKLNNGVISTCLLPDQGFDATTNQVFITYTGNETCEGSPSLAELLISQESYNKAKTVAQVDDVLYWGNLEKTLLDINYQKFANSIEVHAMEVNDTFAMERNFTDVTKNPPEAKKIDMDLKKGGLNRRPEDLHFYKGFQRDEVYAIYIAWVLKDGNETVAYHIPGREAVDISSFCGNDSNSDPIMENNYLSDVVDPNYDIPALHGNIQGNPMLGKLNTYGATLSSTGMGYWENEGEQYPSISCATYPNTCDAYEVWTVTGGVATPVIDPTTSTTKTLAGENVRHHHFPSDAYEEGSGKIWGRPSWASEKHAINRMNPMGFKLVNIPITDEIIKNCLGYKVYYSKRGENDTTVVDCGIFNMMPSYHGPSSGGWGASHTSGSTTTHAAPVNYPGATATGQVSSRGDWDGVGTINGAAYAVQDPPEADGEIVCFPHSACAAPETDVMYQHQRDAYNLHVYDTHYRNDWTAKGKNFTFNGLNTHINNPDVSNLSHVKLTRHLTIGRLDTLYSSSQAYSDSIDSGQLRGFSFFRHDDQGNDYSSHTVHRTFIDWTVMRPEEYDEHGTTGNVLPNNRVDSVTSTSGPKLFKNILALGAAKYIAAGELQSVAHDAGHSPTINNIGGDQTLYLATYDYMSAHDFACTINLYYTFKIIKLIMVLNGGKNVEGCGGNYDCTGTTNKRHVNWVAWMGGKYAASGVRADYTGNEQYAVSHNWMINAYEDSAGCGVWAWSGYSIGKPQTLVDRLRNRGHNSVAYPSPYKWSDQDTWTSETRNTYWHFGTGAPSYMGDWDCDNHVANAQWRVRQAHAYGSIHRVLADVYSPLDTQAQLVYTGHMFPITQYNAAQVISPYVCGGSARCGIMGGDVVIDLYCETRAMKQNGNTYPSGAPSNNVFASSTSSSPVDGHFTNRKTHYTYGIYGDLNASGGEITDIGHQLYITESKVNISMRYSLHNDYEDYYPLVDRDAASINTYFDLNRTYSYNQDYSQLMTLYPTVVFNYKNQTSSISDYPTRIIRSVEYNQRGLVDNFRTYLPGQYRDLPRNRGEIWNLAVYDNLLLPQTERSLWKTKGKEALNLQDISQVALGSGDLFEQEPDEVLYTNRGYAGTVSQYASIVTKHGLFTVDKMAGKVFLLSDKLEEISNYGLKEFFELRLRTDDLVPYGAPYNLDIPTVGIGIIATYDPKHDRIILTKRNIRPKTYFKDEHASGDIYWVPDKRQFYHAGSTNAYISWVNTGYFYWGEDEAWTISYYPSLKLWASFHDYKPTHYFYTNDTLYSVDSTVASYDGVWEQDFTKTSNYYNIGRYYGDDYDVIFEYIDNIQPEDVKTYMNFWWDSTVTNPNKLEHGAREELHNPGFTHAQVYNTNQVSQEINFVEPEGAYNQLYTGANIRFVERNWLVNHFRDDRVLDTITTNATVVHNESNPILLTSLGNAEYNINSSAVDASKAWNRRRRLRDKWLAIRLVQKGNNTPSTSGKLLVTLHSAAANKRKSYR